MQESLRLPTRKSSSSTRTSTFDDDCFQDAPCQYTVVKARTFSLVGHRIHDRLSHIILQLSLRLRRLQPLQHIRPHSHRHILRRPHSRFRQGSNLTIIVDTEEERDGKPVSHKSVLNTETTAGSSRKRDAYLSTSPGLLTTRWIVLLYTPFVHLMRKSATFTVNVPGRIGHGRQIGLPSVSSLGGNKISRPGLLEASSNVKHS